MLTLPAAASAGRRWRSWVVAGALLLSSEFRAVAEMTESSTGRIVQALGTRWGFERRETFWSGYGDIHSWELALGPVGLSGTESPLSQNSAARKSMTHVRIGSRLHVVEPDSARFRLGAAFVLLTMTAILGGLLRRRALGRRPPASPAAA